MVLGKFDCIPIKISNSSTNWIQSDYIVSKCKKFASKSRGSFAYLWLRNTFCIYLVLFACDEKVFADKLSLKERVKFGNLSFLDAINFQSVTSIGILYMH